MLLLERRENGVAGIGLAGRGSDASTGEPLIGRQGLEQRNHTVEVVDDLITRLVTAVAARLESADAGAVGGPLVLPEGFI